MPCHSLRIIIALSVAFASFADVGRAVELKGKFVLAAGEPVPALQPVVDPKAAVDFPGAKFFDESLLVDPQSHGIANVLVYVRTAEPPITPEALAAVRPIHAIGVRQGVFEPRVSGVWNGKQKLVLRNGDAVAYCPDCEFANNSVLLQPKSDLDLQLHLIAPARPQSLMCTMHPWMKAYLVVRHHPYVAVSAKDGLFSIKHLPTGVPLEFQVWHEKSGYLSADPTWTKGCFTITLEADRDLGVIQVPLAEFR